LTLVALILVAIAGYVSTLSSDRSAAENTAKVITPPVNIVQPILSKSEVIATENEQLIPGDEFVTQKLQEEFDWIAKSYEQQSRYPITSQVVVDVDLARSPEPFQEAEVEMQLPGEDGELSPIRLVASVDKMQYFLGDSITLRLGVEGTEDNESISANVNIKRLGGADLMPSSLSLVEGSSENFYQALVETNALNLGTESQELLAKFSVQIEGEKMVTTVPFFFSASSARLENVGMSQQNGQYLTIPLEYYVTQAGYYFASAYLDDMASGRPLLLLQTEGRMKQGNSVMVLKAHHQALKDAGSPGPYRLRVTKSFRGAEAGQGNDVPTAISQPAYEIPAYPFEHYDDTPHSDPEVEERLEELHGLGNAAR